MRRKVGWVLLLSLGTLLVSGGARAQCTKDTDCKGERLCESGKCVEPPVAASPASPVEAPIPAPDATSPATTPAPAPVVSEKAPEPVARPVDRSLELRPKPASTSDLPAGAIAPLPADEPITRRRSRSAMVAGIVMVSAGPISLLGALAAKNAQERCDDNLQRDYPSGTLPTAARYRAEDCDDYSTSIYLFGVGGAILTAVGIPLIIYGAKSVPAERPAARLQMVPWATREAGGLKLRLTL
jgi:hypothetical protein